MLTDPIADMLTRIRNANTAMHDEVRMPCSKQKVALAKWLISDSLKLLVLDHPTRGLDVGAKSDVYTLIRELAGQGIAIVLMADTLEETIALSHRVIVMKDGRIAAEFDAPTGNKPSQVDVVKEMV